MLLKDKIENVYYIECRNDRWADIEMPLFEKCKTMKVGLEIKAKVTAEEYRAMKKAV